MRELEHLRTICNANNRAPAVAAGVTASRTYLYQVKYNFIIYTHLRDRLYFIVFYFRYWGAALAFVSKNPNVPTCRGIDVEADATLLKPAILRFAVCIHVLYPAKPIQHSARAATLRFSSVRLASCMSCPLAIGCAGTYGETKLRAFVRAPRNRLVRFDTRDEIIENQRPRPN